MKINIGFLEDMAKKGSTILQVDLALIYLKGNGVRYNYKRGRYWLEKAARAGDTRALFCVAWYFQTGRYGYPKNNDICKHWWQLHHKRLVTLAAMGDADAIEYVSFMTSHK